MTVAHDAMSPGTIATLLARWTAVEPSAAEALSRLLSVLVTAGMLLVAYRVFLGLLDRVLPPGRDGALPGRAATVNSLLKNVARWVVAFVGLVIVLRELGIDVGALLVSAGVIGLAIGFGAQSLIRDVITGVFLLFEGLLAVDDVIQVGAHTGTVESIGLRVTTLRMLDGALHIVPNGQLTEFTNFSSGWARAVVDVGVPREVPVDEALAVLRRVGEEWARASGAALDAPQAEGIIKFSGAEAVLRLMVKVAPARRFDAEAELRRRVKDAFDRQRWSPVGVP